MKYYLLATVILIGTMFYAGNQVLMAFELNGGQDGTEWGRMLREKNRGEIFKKRTNGVDNIKLIRIARESLIAPSKITVNGIDDQIPAETNFNPAWFGLHKPRSIYFGYEKYTVNWLYLPGCEEKFWDATSTPNWFDRDDNHCTGGWDVNVVISDDLKPTSIDLIKN